MTSRRGRGRVVRAASSRLISGMVSGIMPGSGGGSWPGRTGGGADGKNGQDGHHQHGVAGDRGVEPGLALVEPEAVLVELEIFFYRPSEPGGTDQPGLGQDLPAGHPAVVKGQLAGLQMALTPGPSGNKATSTRPRAR